MGKKAVKVALKSKGTTAIKRSKDHSTKTIQKNTKTNKKNVNAKPVKKPIASKIQVKNTKAPRKVAAKAAIKGKVSYGVKAAALPPAPKAKK